MVRKDVPQLSDAVKQQVENAFPGIHFDWKLICMNVVYGQCHFSLGVDVMPMGASALGDHATGWL